MTVQVFQIMRALKKKPDLQHYHNLVAACRKCGLGETERVSLSTQF